MNCLRLNKNQATTVADMIVDQVTEKYGYYNEMPVAIIWDFNKR